MWIILLVLGSGVAYTQAYVFPSVEVGLASSYVDLWMNGARHLPRTALYGQRAALGLELPLKDCQTDSRLSAKQGDYPFVAASLGYAKVGSRIGPSFLAMAAPFPSLENYKAAMEIHALDTSLDIGIRFDIASFTLSVAVGGFVQYNLSAKYTFKPKIESLPPITQDQLLREHYLEPWNMGTHVRTTIDYKGVFLGFGSYYGLSNILRAMPGASEGRLRFFTTTLGYRF